MLQEHKELLIKDLCSRLPYGLMIDYKGIRTKLQNIKVYQLYNGDVIKDYICLIDIFGDDDYVNVENIKPYLLPLSSMTEEQKRELNKLSEKECKIIENVVNNPTSSNVGFPVVVHYMIDWCNKNHFDYHGLIPMGLAIDATGLNIY